MVELPFILKSLQYQAICSQLAFSLFNEFSIRGSWPDLDGLLKDAPWAPVPFIAREEPGQSPSFRAGGGGRGGGGVGGAASAAGSGEQMP